MGDALRIIEPKRHAKNGYLYHNCPKIDDNIESIDCKGCEFFVDLEKLNTRYRVHCNYPIDGYPLRIFEPAKAYDRVGKYKENEIFNSPNHTTLQPKLDGVRCIIHCTPEGIFLTTRRKNKQGEYSQFQDNVPHIRDHVLLNKIGKVGYTIFDGEIIAPVDDDTLAITMGIVGSLPEKAIAHQEEYGYAYLSLFDVVHWNNKDVSNLTQKDRYDLLKKIPQDDIIKIIVTGNFKSSKKRKHIADKIVKLGYEGIILKDPQATYFSSRAWLKWKEKVSFDVLLTGWELGAAGGRYSHTLGALKVSVIDNATGELREVARVIPGDDDVRDALFRALDGLDDKEILHLYQVIELEGQTWTKDGRIRHPRILRYRSDRSEPNIMDFSNKYPTMV